MGNPFAIFGLGGEANHGRRDVNESASSEEVRPPRTKFSTEVETAKETLSPDRTKTKLPTSYSGAPNVGRVTKSSEVIPIKRYEELATSYTLTAEQDMKFYKFEILKMFINWQVYLDTDLRHIE